MGANRVRSSFKIVSTHVLSAMAAESARVSRITNVSFISRSVSPRIGTSPIASTDPAGSNSLPDTGE
jgi:hypothetical protein